MWIKVVNDEVIVAAQINGMTNDFLCATLRNAANEIGKPLLMISSNPIDSAKSGSRDMAAKGCISSQCKYYRNFFYKRSD